MGRKGLVWVGVCTVVMVAGCGGGGSSSSGNNSTPTAPSTPTQSNRAPVINSLNVSPGFGISELTSFVYSGSASDPDGDAVTYSWDLAGTPRSGENGTITFIGSGGGSIRLTVSDSKGATATDTRTIVLGNATGTWRGSGVNLGSFTMALTQSGARVTGTYSDPVGGGQIDPAQPGSINAAGHLDMRIKQGPFTDWNFRGDMDQSGRRITGQIFGSGFNGQAFTMDKQ